MKKYFIIMLIIFSFILFCQFSCKGRTGPVGESPKEIRTGTSSGSGRNGKLKVVTTILPLYDIAKNLGGDLVEVHNLLPPGGSPHTYEPSVEDSKRIEDADIIFMLGLNLDNWMEKLAGSLGKDYGGKLIIASSGVETIPISEIELGSGEGGEHGGGHEKDRFGKNSHSDADPHVWMDPRAMKVMAGNIRDAYIKLLPDKEELIGKNYNTYIKKLDELDKFYEQSLSRFKTKRFITFHSFLAYAAKRYGLQQVAVISAFPGQEPDPKHIIECVEILKKNNVKVVFAEPQFSPKASEAIAREIGGKVVIIDPMGSLLDPKRDTYIKNMEENLKALIEAFEMENR